MLFNFCFIPIISFILFLFFMLSSSFTSVNSSIFFNGILFDEISLFITYMTCFVIFISFIFCYSFISVKLSLVITFMLLVCVIVFVTDNIFILYLFYEASLVPILYIIIKWGSYPERSIRAIMLLVYTSIFTFPFLYIIFSYYTSYSFSFCFFIQDTNIKLSPIFSLITVLAFSVKLPIYGLHFWLPIAHVEAPTFGSIILAGVLLKLGGVGLIRFSYIIDIAFIKRVIFGYLCLFLCYSTFVCCFQSDFKRLVAYSSVSHIITIPIILLSNSFVSFKGLLAVMFLHGISSPLLFMLVGVMYSYTATRQHVLMRGLLCISPLLSFIIVISFFFTVSAPPYPSFLAEVLFVYSFMASWFWGILSCVVFLFLSMVYNLLWLSSINFLNQDSNYIYSYSFSYSSFYPIIFCLFLIPFLFSSLFFFLF